MGCFDRVYITCPKCYHKVEFQSKAGRCAMAEFDEDRVPLDIAADIEGDYSICSHCKSKVYAEKAFPIDVIPMKGALEPVKKPDPYEDY